MSENTKHMTEKVDMIVTQYEMGCLDMLKKLIMKLKGDENYRDKEIRDEREKCIKNVGMSDHPFIIHNNLVSKFHFILNQ